LHRLEALLVPVGARHKLQRSVKVQLVKEVWCGSCGKSWPSKDGAPCSGL